MSSQEVHRSSNKGWYSTLLYSIALQLDYFHMFKVGAYIKDMSGEDWAQTLVSQTGNSITWYSGKLNVEEIIFSCISFPNGPLIRSKGCIRYNPTLALRQFRYPLRNRPENKELKEIIFHGMGMKNPSLLHKIIKDWNKVHVRGVDLRRRDATSKEYFSIFIQERVKEVKHSFIIKALAQPVIHAHIPISFEETDEMRAMIARLSKDNEGLLSDLNKEICEKMVLKRNNDHKK
ncbi:hypothetical protein KIW84_054121 [Lathyrus oleraceus]|uniref:DUF7745 domain-containing protein n=1 Tax=Pisum sativum TaxID=3888 RepID=A0A9D5AHW4_PEA|nr:hypothetical protein KIW84_054121 [Pisum sativum]